MVKESTKKSNKKLVIFSIITLVFLALFGFVFYKILEPKPIEVKEKIVLLNEYKNTDGSQIEIAKLVDEDKVVDYFENIVKEKKDFVKRFLVLDKDNNKRIIELSFTCTHDLTNNIEYILNSRIVD